MEKDLRSLLGQPVTAPFSRPYCGNGNLVACREALWTDVKEGAERLAAKQKVVEPKKWRAAPVRIEFPPDPLMSFTMRWTNRSTFQQVITFTGHGPAE